MKKYIFLLILGFITTINTITAQSETCESQDEQIEDLNSITKCSIETQKKGASKRVRQISVKVSAPTRYLKRRTRLKKKVSGLTNLSTSGIEIANKKVKIAKPISIKNKIDYITNKLSVEQVKTASIFEKVDQIPLFKSCESGGSSKENLSCYNKQMMLHIQKHFRYPNEAMLAKIQGEVWVRFIIDQEGNVTNIKTLGPANGELLKEEAVRVVSNLPQFIPAVKKGKKVITKYGFPISFSLED